MKERMPTQDELRFAMNYTLDNDKQLPVLRGKEEVAGVMKALRSIMDENDTIRSPHAFLVAIHPLAIFAKVRKLEERDEAVAKRALGVAGLDASRVVDVVAGRGHDGLSSVEEFLHEFRLLDEHRQVGALVVREAAIRRAARKEAKS